MKSITVEKIVVTADKGKIITECLRQCIELAAKERRIVELKHSGIIYRVDIEKLIDSIQSE